MGTHFLIVPEELMRLEEARELGLDMNEALGIIGPVEIANQRSLVPLIDVRGWRPTSDWLFPVYRVACFLTRWPKVFRYSRWGTPIARVKLLSVDEQYMIEDWLKPLNERWPDVKFSIVVVHP